MKRKISILGSTGSIGLSTLKIIDKKKGFFKPYIFLANKNFKLIKKQIFKYKPTYFIINDEKTYIKVLKYFKKNKIKIFKNLDELKIKRTENITVSAIPGIAGLRPTLQSIKFSSKVLLANKEAIICGWNLILGEAKKYKTKLIPVDSEHYSVLKLLENQDLDEIKKIYLTASGGPFLNYKPSKLKKVKASHALKHPKWKMGKKISIDSATLMNKIFEVIEAQKIFNLSNNKIDIVIHPNSLVHAILVLKNGIKKFIYHETSMIIPLANAIFDGKIDINQIHKIKNSPEVENLLFKKINKKIFPAIKLKDRMNRHPSSPIIINAANEVLVDLFLKKKVGFLDMNKTIMAIFKDSNFKKYAVKKPKNISQIYLIDFWARKLTMKKLKIKHA